jgi:hypothetical protein
MQQQNTKPTLLILAAGMGSRYGGLKQIDPVGPHGETIMDYSVYDALRAGFGKIVFVIRKDIEAAFRESIGARFEKRLPVSYVFQELEMLPPGFSVPATRKKPWGTGHAILMAEPAIQEPFAVINADDFYGANSYQVLGEHLRSGTPDYAMVGFILRNTLSEHGSVARGICNVGPGGFLQTVTEITKIEKAGTGAQYEDASGAKHSLTGEEIVSMNIWGFTPALFAQLRREFSTFLTKQGQEEKSEFFIPTVANTLVQTGQARLKVLTTRDSWFGVTYREDRPTVVEGIRNRISRGDYPEKLWA